MNSDKSIIIGLVIGLLIGGGTSYVALNSQYQAKVEVYESKLDQCQSDNEWLNQQVDDLNQRVSSLESNLTQAHGEIDQLESELTNAQSTIQTYKSEVSELNEDLEKILGIQVPHDYEWDYRLSSWTWRMSIPLSLYYEYWDRGRPANYEAWADMATDPKDDEYIDGMLQEINSAAIEEGFTEKEKVEFVINFIQSLPYTTDSVTTPWNEYPRYPIETLFSLGGDCEDTSILAAALLERLGYKTALLILEEEAHAAIGVALEDVYGSYYEMEGKNYFYLETTGEGYELGEIPSGIMNTRAIVIPINSHTSNTNNDVSITVSPRKIIFSLGDAVTFDIIADSALLSSYIEIYDPEGNLYWITDALIKVSDISNNTPSHHICMHAISYISTFASGV